ncbi:MAG: DUF2304 domain-containing protein [Lachnospiraceae bacterium]|nr:DUF2304 domain-containing protein [Lachnospiraceae bacterium]
MNIRLQIVLACLILIGLAGLVRMARRGKIEWRYALPWALMGLILLLLDVFPGIAAWLAGLIGVQLPSNMLFLFGFAFVLWMLFLLSTALSASQKKITQMAQEIARMKAEQTARHPEGEAGAAETQERD